MAFSRIMAKVRCVLLCTKEYERKPSLDIGSPTNVRCIDISDAIPGLTDAERQYIREKASGDAMHLLSLRSHPHTSTPSPTTNRSATSSPLNSHHRTSLLESREPSEALLNAASKDLPNILPTPPRLMHNESSLPATRMKTMSIWEDAVPEYEPARPARALSFSLQSSRSRSQSSDDSDSTSLATNNSALLLKHIEANHDTSTPLAAAAAARAKTKRSLHESFMTLNLNFEWEDKENPVSTPRTLSLSEGFEVQDLYVGDGERLGREMKRNTVVATSLGDSSTSGTSDSGSEMGAFGEGEKRPLMRL